MSPLTAVSAAGSRSDGTITAPSIAYAGLLPILIVLGAACLGVLVEAVVPREQRFSAQLSADPRRRWSRPSST